MGTSTAREIHVTIGDVRIGRGNELLRATLGSCVGIALFWKERKMCGLAHCLLPEGEYDAAALRGRFVNQAVPSLMALMKIRAEDAAQIEAVVVGGGNMTASKTTPPERLVGTLNARTADLILRERGFNIVHTDIGGQQARQITVKCSDGSFSVKKIPRCG